MNAKSSKFKTFSSSSELLATGHTKWLSQNPISKAEFLRNCP